MEPPLRKPDFLIMGIDDPQSGGVWLIASDSLFEASINIDYPYDDIFWNPFELYARPRPSGPPEVSINTKMSGYVWIWGETYADAMQTLQREWTPKSPARPALESRGELEP